LKKWEKNFEKIFQKKILQKNFEKKFSKKFLKKNFEKQFPKKYFPKKSFENKSIFQKKFNPSYQKKPTSLIYHPLFITEGNGP